MIGSHLATLGGSLYYWREGDFELDFVWEYETEVHAIEVKSGLRKNSKSLGKFLKKYPNVQPVIIGEDNVVDFLVRGRNFFK